MSKKQNRARTQEEMDELAKHTAHFAQEERMHCHRGLLPLGGSLYVLFGNDCYSTDARSKAEAEAVHEAAKSSGCLVSAIQTDKSGMTWAVAAVATKRVAESLLTVAWDTWFKESKVPAAQHETEGETNADEQEAA